jgi:hypothetical protein
LDFGLDCGLLLKLLRQILGRWPNVVTSVQFERILSASGPSKGIVQRPSDQKHPVKVAWIQCVGSRDCRPSGGKAGDDLFVLRENRVADG